MNIIINFFLPVFLLSSIKIVRSHNIKIKYLIIHYVFKNKKD